MKLIIMIYLSLLVVCSAQAASDNSCDEFDKMGTQVIPNDIGLYKYQDLGNGTSRVCYKTYEDQTKCGCYQENDKN